jgi:polyisoprenoid-binding protein YceI
MTSWKIDPAHSAIEFRVRHMMISNVRGEFKNFEGTVEFDPEAPENTRVEISIDTASIDTKVGDRDNHLRSADFFEAETYPQAIFKSNRTELLDPAHAKLYGDLTLKGITKPVVLEVEFAGLATNPWGATSAGFTGWTKINRKDWNLNWNVALETGGFLVGDDIALTIEIELIKVVEAQPEVEAEASAD